MSTKLSDQNARSTSVAPLTFDRPNLVFVEGHDDANFIAMLIDEHLEPEKWHVHSLGGNKTGWGARLDVALADDWFSENGRSVTLIQDADADGASVLKSLRDVLKVRSLPTPNAHGKVARGNPYSTMILVLPDGNAQGALEDLLLASVRADRRELADDYISKAEATFAPLEHRSKNQLMTYIAGHVEHVRSLPVALKHREMFDPVSPAFSSTITALAEVQGP